MQELNFRSEVMLARDFSEDANATMRLEVCKCDAGNFVLCDSTGSGMRPRAELGEQELAECWLRPDQVT